MEESSENIIESNVGSEAGTNVDAVTVSNDTTSNDTASREPSGIDTAKTDLDTKGSVESDKHQYTDLERANYSFHKQLSKQKRKYESMLSEMQSRLERLENPTKYAKKLRNDFETDDDYINYLAESKFQDVLTKQLRDYEERQKKLEEQNEQDRILQNEVNNRINEFYPDESSKNEFKSAINDANQTWGLVDIIDSDENKDISDFILYSPVGPKIMHYLAQNKNVAEDIFNSNERIRNMKLRNIEFMCYNSVNTNTNSQQTIQQSTSINKPIGRPGVQQNVIKKPWDSKEGLLKLAGF